MSGQRIVYAQDVNYWRTGTTSPDKWIEKTKTEIKNVGGTIDGEAYMERDGKRAYTLLFTMDGDPYRVTWPVLPLKPNNRRTPAELRADDQAAKIQATTFMFNDIKAKCMIVKVFGPQSTFLQYRVMPDGSTPNEQALLSGRVDLPTGFLIGGGQ